MVIKLKYEQLLIKKMLIHKDNCRVCKSKDLIQFLDLGIMPSAGGFLKKEDISKEKLYPLNVYFCRNCGLVQILDIIPAKELFLDYRYLSSATITLSKHFQDLAKKIKERYNLNKDSLVVEIGSNDGVFLKPMSDLSIKTLGFEPAKNIAKIAENKGLDIVNDFFTEENAKKAAEKGKADIIVASNVFAHIDDLDDVMKGIKAILKGTGVFVFEVHYIVDLIEKIQYDTIYHEHLCYYSVKSLQHLMERFGMEIIDVERIPIHSGSIRVCAMNKDKEKIKDIVKELLELENDRGLHEKESYTKFSEEVKKKRKELITLLRRLKEQGKKIIGYGAAGRGTILLNYCKIDASILDYIVDISPERAGRFMPGMHIPIVTPNKIKEIKPDYALILAWSYTKEIMNKEKEFIEKGGKFIIPLPEVKIVP